MPSATDANTLTVLARAPARIRRVEHGHAIRDDIQLLRGIAVLSVLLYHLDSSLLAGGYLGVDVFFVVSGFLITRNIFRSIRQGTFSYASFIASRFRRLLPACYTMLVFSATLATVFLTRQDMAEFVKQTLGTLTFSSNFVLWRQSGYFDTDSSLKLLLHTWSLSLEEQYYLFLPPILYLGLRRRPLGLLLILLAGSLLACFTGMYYKPSAVFYLLPFRAWELLAGSVCALLMLGDRVPVIPGPVRIVALAVLLLTVFFPPSAVHPGPGALLVVSSTAILMVGAINFGRGVLARVMYFFGDISYSLYLLHWPLLAVVNHVYAGGVPATIKLSLMVTAIVLSYLSFRLVEQPFRNAVSAPRRRVFLLAAGVGILVMLFASSLYASRPAAPGGRSVANAPNYGLGRACAFDAAFVSRPDCQSAARPAVLLWGDSYAMHLADALEQQQRFGFVQATKSLCGPVPGLAPVTGVYTASWAKSCLSFNDSVWQYLEAHPEIRLIILGSKWRQYFEEEVDGFLVRSAPVAKPEFVTTLDRNVVLDNVRELAIRIANSGRKLLIVYPPPSAPFNIYRCMQRKREGLPYIGASDTCRFDQAASLLKNAGLDAMLRDLAGIEGVQSYSLYALLCDGRQCRPELDGVPLYRDEGHLSPTGSRTLGKNSGLNAFVDGLLGARSEARTAQ